MLRCGYLQLPINLLHFKESISTNAFFSLLASKSKKIRPLRASQRLSLENIFKVHLRFFKVRHFSNLAVKLQFFRVRYVYGTAREKN